MPYNTKAIKKDVDNKPVPQYFNVAGDDFQALQGAGGATWVTIYDGSGNAVSVVSNKLAVRASEIEALLAGGLPAALTAGGGVKVGIVDALPAGNNNIGDVDIASSVLPTGAATSAKQDSAITLLAGGLPATLTTGGGIKTGVVDALPAGTNTIGGIKQVGNDTMLQGNKTLTGVAQQIHANTASKNICIQADPRNTGYVYVGKSDVSDSVYMFILTPGSSTPAINLSNWNLLYVLGTSGDKISYGGEV